jgi:ribosomal protein L29
MKIYQIKDLAKNRQDLLSTLKDSYEALENFRFQHASGQIENYKAMRNTKKTIARILTVINAMDEKEKNQKTKA